MVLLGVGISIAVVVFVGFLVSKRIAGDSANFLVGGRGLPLILVGGALMGSAVDTNATLGNTDLAAEFGFWAGACLPLGLALCLVFTGVFFAKPMNRMGLTSFPDYYRLRFGRQVEAVASLMLIVGFCLLVAGNLVAGGFLFHYFVGIPYWFGTVIIAALAVAYTGTGGLIADAYTAIIQMMLVLIGAVGLLIWMAATHGIAIADGTGPLDLGQLTDPAQGATINWATLIALGIGDIVAIDFMQRVFAAKSPETARRACFGAATGVVAICVPFGLVVLSAKAFLPEDLDGPILFVLLDRYAPVALTIVVLCWSGRSIDEHRQRRDPGDLQRLGAQPRRRAAGARARSTGSAAVGDPDRDGPADAGRDPDRRSTSSRPGSCSRSPSIFCWPAWWCRSSSGWCGAKGLPSRRWCRSSSV